MYGCSLVKNLRIFLHMALVSTHTDPVNGADNIVGPFTQMSQTVANFVWNTAATNIPQDLEWEIVLLTLAIAGLIWVPGGDGWPCDRTVGHQPPEVAVW